jgi:apolipoprotein D and lipocalin family protein
MVSFVETVCKIYSNLIREAVLPMQLSLGDNVMKRLLTVFSIVVVSAFAAAAQQTAAEVRPVASVDLQKYSGQWYEIAKYPNKFQKQCVGNTTATYTIKSAEKLEVLNRCLERDGTTSSAKGAGKVVDKQTNAKLKVRFAPGFLSFLPQVWGDYWIIDLDPEYRYSVVGEPKREYLWILSREPEMSDALYQQILRKVEAMGFQPGKLEKTPQGMESLKGTVVTD